MKILINGVGAYSVIHGVERYIYQLTKNLVQTYPADEFILLRAPWQAYYENIMGQANGNLRIITLDVPRQQAGRHIWHSIVFPDIARRMTPDVVHLPNTLPLFISYYKVVSTIHDVYEFEIPENFSLLNRMYRQSVARAQARRSDWIATDSNYSKQRLVDTLKIPGCKASVVWLGMSWEQSDLYGDGSDSEPASPPLNEEYILFVGSIAKHKNVCALLEAFRVLLNKGFCNHHLVIVGRPSNAWQQMRNTINSLSLQDTVHYLPDVNDKELRSLYRNATVFAMPSLLEGFGIPAVDAMCMGIPVIASNRGSLPEICGDAACLVDPLDTEGIANLLQKVISDDSYRNELARRSLERSKLFSWVETARKTHSIYKNVTS